MASLARQVFSETAERKPAFQPHAPARRNQPIESFPDGLILQRKPACACGGGCPACQAKSSDLKVSQPNDPAEIEADQIAGKVMRMPVGETASAKNETKPSAQIAVSPSVIHRKCDACEEEKEEEIPETIQRKEAFAAAAPTPPPDGTPPSIRNVITSGGSPLDHQTRSFFEPRFGTDLSQVRIHTDSAAGQSARAINARAYTLGNNIVFGSGEFSPAHESGKSLLAHELAHVAQFSGRSEKINRSVVYRAPGPFDDVFGSPGGGESQSMDGGAQGPVCPPVPTHLGDKLPEPSCPKATHMGINEVGRVHFCLDSDKPTDFSELVDLTDAIPKNHPKTQYFAHGYASSEGAAKYNFNLACHRANTVAEVLKEPIAKRSKGEARIETATQGPASEFGKPEENRVVVVYAQSPGVEEKEEPDCKDAPRGIGNIRPEVPCDLPAMDIVKTGDSSDKTQFRFCLDSDVLADVHPEEIRKFAHEKASKSSFIIHGFSSTEGAADYNQRLSCHRALRIARELRNAGVPAEKIREVAGLGETTQFGDEELNRTAVIFAEGGTVDPIGDDSRRDAKTVKQKEAIRDEAVNRLLAGQYKLDADAYISFWTCGRTRTVGEAVERLTVNVKKDNEDEKIRAQANGTEEGIGVNRVTLSNAALHADNPIECVMGRLVDMAFHHAVMGYSDLPAGDRHRVGLHLIHRAGLGACEGKIANPTVKRGDELVGISKPIESDPRANRRPPACAEAAEPARLHPPVKGAEKREVPAFNLVGQPDYKAGTGKIENDAEKQREGAKLGIVTTRPETDMLTAFAEVQLSGQPDTFADYEVGFVQAVLSDEIQADYVSGNHVIQQLPTPIRMAEMAGDARVPAPWTTLNAMQRPDSSGRVSITTSGIGLNSKVVFGLKFLGKDLPNSGMAQFEHSSEIAIWLIARRIGAPLDRFSIHFIDGATYSLIQLGQAESRRVSGEIDKTKMPAEHELFVLTGGFHAVKSIMPADIALIQLKGATAADISVQNQVKKITGADAARADGMDKAALTAAIADILDNLILFKDDEDAKKGVSGTKMPRLGYDFIPLTISIPFVRATGRIETPSEKEIVTEVKGPGLGFDAAGALARALEFRIHDRSFEGKGRDVVVRPSIIPVEKDVTGEKETGTVEIQLQPLPRKKDAPAAEEPDLVKRPGVLTDMAEAWACSVHTDRHPDEFGPNAIEFGAAYTMDRARNLSTVPSGRLQSGKISADEEVREMDMPCPNVPDGVRLGAFHTHPEPVTPPEPSEADIGYTKKCNSHQHYIVTDNKVFQFLENGEVIDLHITLPKVEGCHEVNLTELRKQVKD